MSLRGINRIIVAVRDLEESKQYYSALLGASFKNANWTGENYGINVAISWDAGIELCAPMEGRENDCAVSQFLNTKGEGVLNVVFNYDDTAKALNNAKSMDIQCLHSLDYTQEEIDAHLDALFSKYEEHVLNTSGNYGFSVTIAQITKKP
jgi:catechol 2,3-dioxygenase-like lactoylglutathione lyase family enzyme